MLDEQTHKDEIDLREIKREETRETPTVVTSIQIAEMITEEFPQEINGVPTYLITGSLAVKLALQAERITRLSIQDRQTYSPQLTEATTFIANEKEQAELATLASGLTIAPKDVDLIQANAGFPRVNESWKKLCESNFPCSLGKRWYENINGKPLLVEEMKPDQRFHRDHPIYRNWTRVWVHGKSFLTINPVAVLAVRNSMFGKNEGSILQQTQDYKRALQMRFPELYARPVSQPKPIASS